MCALKLPGLSDLFKSRLQLKLLAKALEAARIKAKQQITGRDLNSASSCFTFWIQKGLTQSLSSADSIMRVESELGCFLLPCQKSTTFSSLMENPLVGKKLKS